MSFDFQISQNRKRVKNRIRALNPNAFENYIASVFEKLGYSVLQTPLTNDGGKDIIASLNGHTYYIECKHFTEGSVGREIIQKLVGAGVLDGGVDGYVLATTSYYNDNALKCLEKASVPLVLLDLDDLAYLEELAEKESDKDILSFPEGYDTMVGERGSTLSGGQRQRVCLARAFYKAPSRLVLDDSLSAVDADTEKEILDHLRTRKKKRTTFVIAHRVSTLENADKILVMDEGRIVGMGTHKELLQTCSLYHDIVEMQKLQKERN